MSEHKTYHRIELLLDEVPGQSVKELSIKLGEHRTIVAGYLRALEDLGYVASRRVGPAKVYSNRKPAKIEVQRS